MFVEECRRVITAAPRLGLDALAQQVWAAYGSDVLSADEASELCEAIAARRAPPPAAPAPRRTGSRARSPASVERRRAWAASSWLPPRLAARFSPAEQAVLGVVLSTIALTGRCEWCHGAVAGRSGTSVSTVKRALAQARVLGLVIVEERRLSWARSLPSVVTIASAELRTWVATRGRGLRAARGMWGDGGGVQTGAASKSISKLSLSNAAPTSPERVWRGRGGQAGGSPPARPPAPGSTPGPLRSPYSGTRARRV